MSESSFDQYADAYDAWFYKNENLLKSEVRLVAHFLRNGGKTFSVGCGSGLFESIMNREFGIQVSHGIEPSADMADIARKRGMEVVIATAEEADYGTDLYDTVLFNGTPSYISNLQQAFEKAHAALHSGGQIVVIDVPKESSYALLYNLAMAVGTWEHPLLEGVQPPDPYPIEFVKAANWRTTEEKVKILERVGFSEFEFAQTLTHHPIYSNQVIEDPIPGYDRGDYVAIRAIKE